jgi:formate dehydrogenase subunit gamma
MVDIAQVLATHASRRSTLLAALQEVQQCEGFISDKTVALAARVYQITEGEVRSVIEFYRELRTAPPGRHRLCLCRGDSCAARGAEKLAGALEKYLGVRPGQTTTCGGVTYDTVYCLGACALSPSASIDGQVHARLTSDEIIARLKEVEHG